YDTQQQVNVKAEWTGTQGQLNLSYWYSKYNNDSNSLVFQNPYASGTALNFPGGSGFPTGFGRMGLMPSNDFWQVQATGAWNFTPTMRLTGTVAYNVMSQNDPFLPYTINTATQTPGTSLLVPVGLPRTSLNGEIKNTLVDLSFLARPVSKLSLKLNYHYMDRNNNAPSNQYAYVVGDAANQPTPINNANTSAAIVTNLPTNSTENRVKLDADYQIFARTMLRGWYQYTNVSYSPSDWSFRANTQNNLLGVELRRIMSESFTGALRYVYDQRRGADFASQNLYYAAYTAGRVASTNNIDNLPTLRQFLYADYNKNAVIATGTFTPIERVSIGLNANWYQTQYKGPNCGGSADQIPPNVPMPAECQGLMNVVGQAYSIDGSWLFAEGWNAFAFYTYNQFSTGQSSRSFSSSATAIDANRDFNDSIKNSNNTVGLGINFKPADNKYDVGAQYVYTNGTGGYSIAGPWAAPGQVTPAGAQPIPDVTMSSNYFQLYGKYQYSKSLLFRMNYLYQNLNSSDWAFPGNPFATNSVLLTGHQSPTYHNNVFGFSVAYTNW
ncbi:MAG TPA: MtrB/PioB family outer membrane beta-barrel protein, partial [Burkholderiales bacterium]|nr:MtrB/PioB family outer membrane beta-barrel protein [Burkholderiales bacterium]